MRGYRAAFLSLAVLFCAIDSARAGFNMGVEKFDGIALDPSTWSTSLANSGATFSQNNALTINAFGTAPPYPFGGYTTTASVIPVGGSVWAEVRVDSAGLVSSPTFASMRMTTDPSGSDRTASSAAQLSVTSTYYGTSQFQGVRAGSQIKVNNIQTSYGTAGALRTTYQPLGQTYIWQMERLTDTATRFSLFSENGPVTNIATQIALQGSEIQAFFSSSDPMYVFLEGIGTTVTFDNVTINQPLAMNQTVIPEPVMAGVVLISAMFAIGRRRAIRRV